jgi:hypothetical protein
MGSALPAIGAQVRRKVDGTLGEVYSIDASHNRLYVRWPTVPGAFNRQNYTPDQFARSCELTGILVGPPHETHVALSLIVALVLTLFVVVLVKGSNSLYVGYDPYHPVVPGPPSIARNARALHEKFGIAAASACAGDADNYIRSIAAHRFHWSDGDGLTPRFDRFVPTVAAPGVLTMITNKAAISDGFGNFTPITVYCNYDTDSNEVLSYSSSIDNE